MVQDGMNGTDLRSQLVSLEKEKKRGVLLTTYRDFCGAYERHMLKSL